MKTHPSVIKTHPLGSFCTRIVQKKNL